MNKRTSSFHRPREGRHPQAASARKVPVSDLCDELDIYPDPASTAGSRSFFENGHAAFDNGRKAKAVEDAKDEKIQQARSQTHTQERGHGRAHGSPHPVKKKSWGTLTGRWVPHDTRDDLVDFVRSWSDKTDIPVAHFMPWIGIGRSKFHDWNHTLRQGQRAQRLGASRSLAHRGRESCASATSPASIPLEGYRRMTFMMLDADVVACSPASVYRVLKKAGLLAGPDAQRHQERHRLRPAPESPPALARRCQLPQHRRHVLFPLLHPRRLQPLHRPLGNPRKNGGSRRGNHHPTRPRNLPRRHARASSPTTARSSSPRTSRSSSASPA